MYYERFTDRARKVLRQLAAREARRLNHQYVGPEHILAGIVAERFSVAARVLKGRSVNLERIRSEIWDWEPALPDEDKTSGSLPLSVHAKQVIEYAMQECRNLGQRKVSTEHLLLACSSSGTRTGRPPVPFETAVAPQAIRLDSRGPAESDAGSAGGGPRRRPARPDRFHQRRDRTRHSRA